MIEVLVSILLVSIGLLGIAGLSGATFNYNKVAQMRLTGLALVNDFADRARINVYGYDLGAYDIDLSDNFAVLAESENEEDVAAAVAATNIALLDPDPSSADNALAAANSLASADVNQFLRSVSSRLPQGDAVVVSRQADARSLDVWLLWKEPKTDEGDEDDDKGGFSLFDEAKGNCPTNLDDEQISEYSCMYFKVGL
ncbi:type IV pilus modification PilV family protein [Hydrogenophaga luteola]|uniref:Type IV pilus modification protein PilV n=1 Tax=Hydrogenophaga luteola TaxID=1591122 RepID=A0ABV7W885_9BURK